jgi:hypothetical protein
VVGPNIWDWPQPTWQRLHDVDEEVARLLDECWLPEVGEVGPDDSVGGLLDDLDELEE